MSYHGEIKKSKKGQVRWMELLMYVVAVAFGWLAVWFNNPYYFIGSAYIIVHLFSPLDWYLIYELYRKLRRK